MTHKIYTGGKQAVRSLEAKIDMADNTAGTRGNIYNILEVKHLQTKSKAA